MIHLLTIMQRFVDHDMLMRYHWGLGVGHAYSHVRNCSEHNDEPIMPQDLHTQNLHDDAFDHVALNARARTEPINLDDEFSLVDRDGLEWESTDSGDGSDDGTGLEANSMMYEMYGSDWGSEENLD